MASELDRTARKNEAAPLEGAVGKEVASVLNLAFGVMQMNMCLNLAHTMGMGLQGPLTRMELDGLSMTSPLGLMARNTIAGPQAQSPLQVPSFLTMKPPSMR